MTTIPAPKPSNRLGKTALLIHLGGVVMFWAMLGLSYLVRNENLDEAVVGGMGLILFIVSWFWGLVLIFRSHFNRESRIFPLIVVTLMGMELSTLSIWLGVLTHRPAPIPGPNSFIIPTLSRLDFVNQTALPVLIPAISVTFIGLIAYSYLVSRTVTETESSRKIWRMRVKTILLGWLLLFILIPYPLLRFSVNVHNQRWQDAYAEWVLFNFPKVFDTVADPVQFISPRYFDTYDELSARSDEEKKRLLIEVTESSNSKLKELVAGNIFRFPIEPKEAETLFLRYSEDPSLEVRIQGFQIICIPYEHRHFLGRPILERLLELTESSSNKLKRITAHVLTNYFLNRPYLLEGLKSLEEDGINETNDAPFTNEEAAQIKSIQEQTKTWLREHP